MKTTSVYHSFAMQHEELNKEISKRVIAIAPVERLYLLGLTTTSSRTETLFSVQSATRYEVAHYYLMALVEKEDEHSLNSEQSKIENNLQYFVPITAIVLSNIQFAQWLLEGHPFAHGLHERGFLLYQKDDAPLPYPTAINRETVKNEAAQLLVQTETRVQEFLAGAELYTIRVQYKMAAFMLHQAAEQTLRTMLILNTGLRINTHSIDKLVRYCSMFCFKLQEVFPLNNEKEKMLFQLLQKAYIDTRYRDDYNIKFENLTLLTEKIKRLFRLLIDEVKL